MRLPALAVLLALPGPALPCTRALYTGAEGTVITGRSMDWKEDMHSELWAFPRGIARTGQAGPASATWTSRYGSVITADYCIGTSDGMNEQGLVANQLWLAESDYGAPEPRQRRLSISLWAQYALDNFATVAEAVAALGDGRIRVVTDKLPNGRTAQLHLALSDAGGDSAILEYIAGRLVIHHGKQFRIMTNSPTYDQQLALDAYWHDIGGLTFLPGTNRAADRFARAAFLMDAIPKSLDRSYISAVPGQSYANQAMAGVLSVIRAVSVPLGITTPDQPNISSTIWRTIADQTHKVYAFDSATTPNTFWVDLAKLDLRPGAPIRKLPLAAGQTYSGEVSRAFVVAKPFTFAPAGQ